MAMAMEAALPDGLSLPKSFYFGDAAAFERNRRFNRMRGILPATPIGISGFEI
jgi:hypothetical protein